MNQRLAELYQKIDQRGKRALTSGHIEIDPYLAKQSVDDRYGLSLILHLPAHVTRNITFILQQFRPWQEELYFYPAMDMHITVMDLVGAHSRFSCSAATWQHYIRVITGLAKQIPPIGICLAGLITSPAALLVKGTYSPGLTTFRQRLRQVIPQAGLPLVERYPTISGHVTVARYVAALPDLVQFLQVLANNQAVSLGDFTVDKVELVIHDWYNHRIIASQYLNLGEGIPAENH